MNVWTKTVRGCTKKTARFTSTKSRPPLQTTSWKHLHPGLLFRSFPTVTSVRPGTSFEGTRTKVGTERHGLEIWGVGHTIRCKGDEEGYP